MACGLVRPELALLLPRTAGGVPARDVVFEIELIDGLYTHTLSRRSQPPQSKAGPRAAGRSEDDSSPHRALPAGLRSFSTVSTRPDVPEPEHPPTRPGQSSTGPSVLTPRRKTLRKRDSIIRPHSFQRLTTYHLFFPSSLWPAMPAESAGAEMFSSLVDRRRRVQQPCPALRRPRRPSRQWLWS